MEDPIALSIKARGRNKSGLRVEQREDGYYYVSRVPRGFKGCAVGDRVLEINGISFSRFKNETKANELIDTFQLQIVPIDNDDGMVTTDDDFDFGSDLEEKAATVPSVGLTRGQENKNKNQRQNSAGSSPKKGPGRRENVEYMDDSDSEEQNVPKASKNRAKPSKSVPATKAPPPKGPGRRESVEYIDDDDDDDDENNSPQQQQRSLPSKPGPGRREVVEHLNDDDDTEDEKANSRNGVDRKPQPKKQPQSGGRRRESVEYLDDDDTEDEEQPKQQPQAGGRRRQTVEYLDDEDTEDEEQPKQQKQTGGRRRETVEYVDEDDTEDEEDADDDTDDDEEYEEVTRQPTNAKARNVPGRQPAPTAADDDDVSEYDGDEESRPRDDDDEEEEDDDDDDEEEPPKPLSASSLRHSMARKQDSRRSLYRPPPDAFERPYISDYKPMDRWMVTVHKETDEDVGLSMVQYKSELFITEVDPGPFFKTAIDKGDKVLSINGKKVGKHLSSVTEAEELMEGKTQLTLFVLRPDTERDLGYKWVMENC